MPFDRPTKNELVTAVREFMEDKLLPELQGHINFNTRVAINVLKIVERELTLGEAISSASKENLLALLKENNITNSTHDLNTVLSKKITERKLTYKDQDLIDHLWETTMAKLSVDNPRYVSYRQELE